MSRLFSILTLMFFGLAACAPMPFDEPTLGADGRPLPRVYRISDSEIPRVQFRVLDAVNTLRTSAGAQPLQLDPRLSAAAATHSRDMARQARPWHFGSDGSSPIDRARRAGYTGQFRGELISETYESELETVNAWMSERDTRNVLLDREATDMGFSLYQESNGKIWWTMVLGSRGTPMAGGF